MNADALFRALEAFRRYPEDTPTHVIGPRRSLLDRLDGKDRALIGPLLSKKHLHVEHAVRENALIAGKVYDSSWAGLYDIDRSVKSPLHEPTLDDRAIVRSVIRSLYRDWTTEGEVERQPVLQFVRSALEQDDRKQHRVLIPGAGLSRLAVELFLDGHEVDASEVSVPHLLTTYWALTESGPNASEGPYRIQPWAYHFSNNFHSADQFVSYVTPDLVHNHEVSLARDGKHGLTVHVDQRLTIYNYDFLDLNNPSFTGKYTALVTLFFLDTAPNVMDYIRTIHDLLEPGGLWIFIGPLLWNCWENGPAGRREGDDDEDEAEKSRQNMATQGNGTSGVNENVAVNGDFLMNGNLPLNGDTVANGNNVADVREWNAKIELSFDEVVELVERMGFRVRFQSEADDPLRSGYAQNPRSMLQNTYQAAKMVAVKQ